MMTLASALDHFRLFSDLAGEIGGEFEDWISPLIVLGAMVVVSYVARAFLRSRKVLGGRGRWIYAHRLTPSIVSLIYVIGFRLFIELAPISERLSGWADDVIFVVAVVLVLNLIRKATMIALEIGAG